MAQTIRHPDPDRARQRASTGQS